MSAPTPPSGDAPNETRLDMIRERVGNSTRDALYAPAYADRRYLLGLVDEMAEALRQIYEDVPARERITEAGRVALMAEIARAARAKAGL